jgi:hypothetical protein
MLSLFILAISGACDNISVVIRGERLCKHLFLADMKGKVYAVNSIFIGSSNEIGQFESGVAAKLIRESFLQSFLVGTMTLLVVAIAYFKAPKLKNLNFE